MKLEIRNGRVIDPAAGLDEISTVYCAAGRIVGVGTAPAAWAEAKVLDAQGLVVCPGLVDLAARIGNLGGKSGISFESELRAAGAGGVTAVVTPPDSTPMLDEPSAVEMLKARAHGLHLAHVFPLGALTRGLKGETLSEMHALHAAGCIGFTQAEHHISNGQVMLRAMQYAASNGYTVWLRPLDVHLGARGVMHDGEVATRLGLAGQPALAESIAVATLIALARHAGCALHLCRLSAAESVRLVAEAKRAGAALTCDVSAAHLHLIDVDVGYFDTDCHTQPPFRTGTDRAALRAGLAVGTIDAVVSDHTPVLREAKAQPFAESTPGVSGLDTLLSLVLKWADHDNVSLLDALAKVTHHPARLAALQLGTLAVGAAADLCVFDPRGHRMISAASLASAGKNSPFVGYELPGIVRHTVVGGRAVYDAPTRA